MVKSYVCVCCASIVWTKLNANRSSFFFKPPNAFNAQSFLALTVIFCNALINSYQLSTAIWRRNHRHALFLSDNTTVACNACLFFHTSFSFGRQDEKINTHHEICPNNVAEKSYSAKDCAALAAGRYHINHVFAEQLLLLLTKYYCGHRFHREVICHHSKDTVTLFRHTLSTRGVEVARENLK